MSEYFLDTNNINEWAQTLSAGDKVYLSGAIYTARDAAHKNFINLIKEGESLPFDIKNTVIYYAGPTPAKNGLAVGSIGPTTSSRMDVFAPQLLSLGLKAMIGKGDRNKDVYDAIIKNKCVYFAAIGGAGALYSCCVESCEVVAFPHLGCESVKKLIIRDFPVIVAIDSTGKSLYNL
ncbi:MAG: TRZ/ATZ family protein [Ruminococcaceae bacterium]|nr:TRZ/ATZ family protein [Oscillospiraceae bacterium]